MYDLLINNARRLTGRGGMSESCRIAVKDGKIAAILPRNNEIIEAVTVVDAMGRLVIPGLIDLHVHLREPGYEYKEDIASGTRAAAAGGVTSVFAMPNTSPVCDSPEVLGYINEKAKSASARVFPVAAITKGLASGELCDFDALHAAGAAAFSDDGKPVMSAAMLRRAMQIAAEKDYLIMSHCEEMTLAAGGAVNEGPVSRTLKLGGIPNLAEDLIVARDIRIAEDTGCRLHICHVSTRGAVEIIRQAKARGVRVTAETCPHYFAMCDEDVVFYGANAKMNPPLRSRDDVKAIIEGLLDGTLDCISTDHAPHSAEEKAKGLASAPNGIIGLQTSFAIAYTELVMAGQMGTAELVEKMAGNPARITGLDRKGYGRLDVGSPADMVIVTLGCHHTFTPEMLAGKSANTPFTGMTFGARIEQTFVGGRTVYENKEK